MTREGCDNVDEARVASNKIHVLAGATSSMAICNLRQDLLKIHGVVVELLSVTIMACFSLQKEGIYP